MSVAPKICSRSSSLVDSRTHTDPEFQINPRQSVCPFPIPGVQKRFFFFFFFPTWSFKLLKKRGCVLIFTYVHTDNLLEDDTQCIVCLHAWNPPLPLAFFPLLYIAHIQVGGEGEWWNYSVQKKGSNSRLRRGWTKYGRNVGEWCRLLFLVLVSTIIKWNSHTHTHIGA